ncbi:MAG: ketosteroid isomerase-like protein [Paracoccaceae bacterium]|jgi:ketosteroid isomerase-like protein
MQDFDAAAVEAEIRAAFDAYEVALMANDVTALVDAFRVDPRTVRLTPEGGAWGHDEVAAFRKARDPGDITRDLLRVEIQALSADAGVASASYRRRGSGRTGAQTQVWRRFPEGWRIVAAQVALAS